MSVAVFVAEVYDTSCSISAISINVSSSSAKKMCTHISLLCRVFGRMRSVSKYGSLTNENFGFGSLIPIKIKKGRFPTSEKEIHSHPFTRSQDIDETNRQTLSHIYKVPEHGIFLRKTL